MKKSRTNYALKNVTCSMLFEGTKIACGLILPRLILSNYGSAYNGVVSSVSQFISCIALMKAGVGGATKAALYKPLAEKDDLELSKVIKATENFMRKIALIFVIFAFGVAIVYPLFINDEFGFWFTFSLILIVSISTFGEYYFGYTNQLLMMSDQKEYILTTIGIIQTILSTIVSVILINNGVGIHIIKLASVGIFVISPLVMHLYVKKHYNINHNVEVSMDKIPQRWDAVAHEVATFVNNNSDIIILTFFTSLTEVSVYTVYKYVIYNIKKAIKASVSNFASAFGDMYAKGEHELLEENLSIFELIINSIVSVLHTTTLVMIVPFVMLYTKGITDADYYRPMYAIVAIVANAFDCFRMPYKTVVTALGHFKQTRNGAIFEAVLNVAISSICTYKFGLIGVAIGTFCAMTFRTCQYAYYLCIKVMNRGIKKAVLHILLSLAILFGVYFISKLYMPTIDTWLLWFVYAIITTLLSLAITLITDYIFYKKDFMKLFNKVLKAFNLNNHGKIRT